MIAEVGAGCGCVCVLLQRVMRKRHRLESRLLKQCDERHVVEGIPALLTQHPFVSTTALRPLFPTRLSNTAKQHKHAVSLTWKNAKTKFGSWCRPDARVESAYSALPPPPPRLLHASRHLQTRLRQTPANASLVHHARACRGKTVASTKRQLAYHRSRLQHRWRVTDCGPAPPMRCDRVVVQDILHAAHGCTHFVRTRTLFLKEIVDKGPRS